VVSIQRRENIAEVLGVGEEVEGREEARVRRARRMDLGFMRRLSFRGMSARG